MEGSLHRMASIEPCSPAFLLNPLETLGEMPSLSDDDEFWEVFIDLALEHKAKISKSLDDTLNSLLLFAALFSAVNVGIIAISLPTLNPDPIRGSDPASSILPSKYALKANQVFSASLTCSLLAAFFSLVGKQWLRHYSCPFPTAQLENLRTVQLQLDGTLRWHFKGVVEIALMSLLQISLILFLVEWIPFLHWQGDTVSYPDNGLAHFGAFMLVAMLACASWDRWCPYQTPYTTEFPSALRSAFRYVKILAKMMVTPKKFYNALTSTLYQLRAVGRVVRERPSVLLDIHRRPEETQEKTDVKSLHWMLENAPRGRPLRLVARQVARLKLPGEPSDYQDTILLSPYIHRLHETFWDTLRQLIRNKRERHTENTNNAMEVLLIDIAIFRESIIATSYQWPNISVEEVMRGSFNEYASLRMSKLSWEDFRPFFVPLE